MRLAELARALNLASANDGAEVALARLLGELRYRDRWLVVFDNAEEPAGLARFLPSGPGHVVITSRNPEWHWLATGLEVKEFTRTESIKLLRSRLAHLTEADAHRLTHALGDLPPAVNQAAALLADPGIGLSVDDYLTLLAERTEHVLTYGPGVHPVSVSASWAAAFDRLAVDDPAALQLLTLVAWLAPEPVPLTLLTERLRASHGQSATDPLWVTERTATLRRRGMARVSPRNIQLHRVPAALLRARTTDDGLDGGWAATVVHVVPRIQRPLWVAEQPEVALPEGLGERYRARTAAQAVVANRSSRRRARHLVPLAGAAALIVVAVTGVSLEANVAQPGDTLWGVSKFLYSERAESVKAAAGVQARLERVRTALATGQTETAREELAATEADLGMVRVDEGFTELTQEQAFLEALLEETPPGEPAPTDSDWIGERSKTAPPSAAAASHPTAQGAFGDGAMGGRLYPGIEPLQRFLAHTPVPSTSV